MEGENPQLLAFLLGTVQPSSPLSILRGNADLLRQIWVIVCEEWWDLHIDRTFCTVSNRYWNGGFCYLCDSADDDESILPSSNEVRGDSHQIGRQLQVATIKAPETPLNWIDQIAESDEFDVSDVGLFGQRYYPRRKLRSGGCPVAVVQSGVKFPPKVQVPSNTFKNQKSQHLYVNMMPIALTDIESVPEVCRGYWPLIQSCTRLLQYRLIGDKENVAYLTIDERPVVEGQSQRRAGLHVESSGVLPVIQQNEIERSSLNLGKESEKAEDRMRSHHSRVSGGMFIPGAEHHWGRGNMMRDERVDGGIFMASNVSGTCAVWNCRVWDRRGEVIGPHGNIERLRPLLGAPTRTLDAGELVWMTDKTPHESLPLPTGMTSRQYFRLVVGEVTAWFANHSTPNPTGNITPPASVRIVHGNKFQLYSNPQLRICSNWCCGTADALVLARGEAEVRELAMRFGLGHLVERMILYGITSVDRLMELSELYRSPECLTVWDKRHSADGHGLFIERYSRLYDAPQFNVMVKAVRAKYTLLKSIQRGGGEE